MSNDDNDDEDDDLVGETAPSFDPSAWHGKGVGMDVLLNGGSGPKGMPVSNSPELTRILNLPRRASVVGGTATSEALVELMMRKYSRGPRACRCATIDDRIRTGKRKCLVRLKWEQAWALHEMGAYGGLIASAPVGLGKTLLNVVGALAIRDCRVALLMIPSSLRKQICTDYELIAEHFRVPSFTVHMPGRRTRDWVAPPLPDGRAAPTVHVVPYNFISDVKNSQWIEGLQPNAIICDEVDALADTESSRTIRILRYFEQYWRTTRFFGWTGSLTNNSVSEFAHLLAMALRDRSPLPTDKQVIDEWSKCLDAVPNPCPAGALTRLLEPGEGIHQIRQAFHRRFSQTPGVIVIGGRQVITTDTGAEVKNDIREKVCGTIPRRVLDALALARKNFRPDSMVSDDEDEILVDPLEQARVVRQVATGVFYRWNWNGIPRELALEWMRKRKAWHSELRHMMLQGKPNLDSAKLCENAARRAWGDLPPSAELPSWRAETWPEWRDIKDRCKPTTEAKWIDKWLAEDAADWCASNRGILWYGMREFAAEVGRITGLKVFGEGTGNEIGQVTGEDTIIASIKSHGRGTNGLQFVFDTQAIVNTMASARMYQQLLGRLRRDGQQSEVVSTEIYLHAAELRDTLEQAMRCGNYVQDMTTEAQMLLDGWRGYARPLHDC